MDIKPMEIDTYRRFRSASSHGLLKSMAVCLALFVTASLHADPLRVVTTTEDLAHLARRVGGTHVQVEALLRGYQDPHYADARPDFIVKMSRANVFVQVGLDLEIGWVPVLLRQSRNAAIQPAGPGFCDASRAVRVLEVPSSADRSQGDLHAFGNPHYWLDPLNAVTMARNMRDTFTGVDPAHRKEYARNYARLVDALRTLTISESRLFAPFRGRAVAVYHREFSYLAERFGFRTSVSIEEKPGVPPSAAYLQKVVEEMRRQKIRVILIAPWNNPRYAQAVARQTKARVVVMPVSVLSEASVNSYEDAIRSMLARLRAGLKE